MRKVRKPLVSVVILSWGTLQETTNCIKAIESCSYKNIEIIVLDNGSQDGSKEYLEGLGDKIIYIDEPVNIGFAGGQTEAYKHVSGDYIALVNTDAIIAKDWVDVTVKEMQRDDTIGAIGGKSFDYNDKQLAYDTSSDYSSYQFIDPVYGYAHTLRHGEERQEVSSVSGAGVLIRREAIEQVGYFDDAFFAYYEETDLFARFKRHGYKIVYLPEAHIWHKVGASSKDKPYFYFRQMHRNRYRYAFRNFDLRFIPRVSLDYWLKFTKSGYQVLLRSADLDSKARFYAGLWTLPRMPKLVYDRARIFSGGESYSKQLLTDAAEVVTVVITCYNYGDYVAEAIDSVLDQTHKPARVIILNDGSTDNSKEVIDGYGDRVEAVHQSNLGIVRNKNKGIDMVDSLYTIFLDADDTLPPDYIEKTLRFARLNSKDVVYTDVQYIGAKNDYVKAGKFSPDRFRMGNFIHNSALISTEYLKRIEGYSLDMVDGYEDWEIYIRLHKSGARFGYIQDQPRLNYRQHDSNAGRNVAAIEKDQALRAKIIALHPELGIWDGISKSSGGGLRRLPRRLLAKALRAPYKPRDIKYHLVQNYRKLMVRIRHIKETIINRSKFLSRTRGLVWMLREGDTGSIKAKFIKIFNRQ